MLSEELKRKLLNDKINKLEERQAKFLFLKIFYGGDKSRYRSNYADRHVDSYKKELLERAYEEDKLDRVSRFLDKIHTLYLEEYELTWIEGDKRKQIFVYNYLVQNRMVSSRHFGRVHEKNTKDTIHNILNNLLEGLYDRDTRYSEVDYKRGVTEAIKDAWHILESNDNYSKWLKTADLDWVYNYLVERDLYQYDLEKYVGNNNRELRLLASLDAIDIKLEQGQSYTHSPNKTIIIDKMKRAWSQQKYRDAGKTKKPYHLPLTKKTKARLKKMAQVQGLSETAMLDIVINRFYELDYVDVDGKDLY